MAPLLFEMETAGTHPALAQSPRIAGLAHSSTPSEFVFAEAGGRHPGGNVPVVLEEESEKGVDRRHRISDPAADPPDETLVTTEKVASRRSA